jgi:hypothetical protein
MVAHELEDLVSNSRICPDVAGLAEPTLQRIMNGMAGASRSGAI